MKAIVRKFHDNSNEIELVIENEEQLMTILKYVQIISSQKDELEKGKSIVVTLSHQFISLKKITGQKIINLIKKGECYYDGVYTMNTINGEKRDSYSSYHYTLELDFTE